MKINPEEIIYAITMFDLIRALERRIGKEEANTLSPEQIESACVEVKAAIEHHLDERDYIDMGLDAWELTRNL